MGMEYDEARQCWRLDYPCRINGKATHLKATVHGPRRATQPEAMEKWLDLRRKAKCPGSSLTFGEAVKKYLRDNPQLDSGILSIVNHLNDGLGSVKFVNFRERFEKWIASERKRCVMRWRKVDGAMKLCGTGKPISKSTIRSYTAYARTIARAAGQSEAFNGIAVGSRVIRRRPIEPHEMLLLEEACRKLYPWFYPAFDFARCNPIRPEDQFSLTVEANVKGGRIIYAPKKTHGDTGLLAYPVIWEHQRDWFYGLKSGLLFPRPDGTGMLGKGKYYRFVWEKVRAAAGLPDIQFYDLRHHAVAWMRSCGIEDWRIVRAAGWASAQMLFEYDPDNRHLIEEYDRQRAGVVDCSMSCSTMKHIMANFVKQTGA